MKEESIANPPMEKQESENQGSNREWREQKSLKKMGIDQIRAELFEEKCLPLVESDYWDETHSWGSDNEIIESDDYWHFVGRYE